MRVETAGFIHSIQYYIHIIFTDLERAFKKVYPKYGWTNWTIHKNLRWTENWLCDKTTGIYSDKSINIVANEFFEKIKPRIDKTFFEINSYEELHKVYNSTPSEFIDYIPSSRIEKRIINGLILIKCFDPETYQEAKREYLKLLEKYKGNDITEVRLEVDYGLNFLENNDLKINTIANKIYKQ